MAQDIALLNAVYQAVPAVQLPKDGGGVALFADPSPVTATAPDVAAGKIFLAADGSLTEGTGSGGGGVSWDDLATRSAPDTDVTLTGTSVNDYAFYYAGLAANEWKIHGPNVTYIGQSALRNCYGLTEAHFPTLSSGNNNGYFFNGDTKLALVDFGVMSQVRANNFTGCTVFKTLILRYATAPATLYNTNSFNNTPFASNGSGGTIYIPKVLYDHLGDGGSLDYKAASNWSTVDGWGKTTWAKIEGSVYEL